MSDRFPWRDTSADIAAGTPPQWETPGGAQEKVDIGIEDFAALPETGIADESVTTRKLRDEAVDTPKLAPEAVTLEKMAPAPLDAANHTYSGVVAAGTVKEAIDVSSDRVEYFIANSGNSVAEIVDARIPETGSPFPKLGDRLNNTDAQLADVATITSSSYGIAGNGTDETAKLAAMMAAIPANGANVIFDKTKEITVNGTSLINISNKHNVVIEGLKIKGTSAAVFQITDGSSNITFRDCYFSDAGQVIYLFTCSKITIDNCVFDNAGYGIIQRLGFASDTVKIINCTARNMKKDFIEANCTSSARSKNWIISGNVYEGSLNYEAAKVAESSGDFTTYRECRFVGITAVDNVIISNNVVQKVAGDSAIHLEDVGTSYQITNNVFDNILGRGYIFILPTSDTADDSESIIDDNTFLRTDAAAGIGNVLSVSSNIFANEVAFTNNRVVGLSSFHNLSLSADVQKNKIVRNNTFRYCTVAVSMINSSYAKITGNTFRDCDKVLLAPSLKFSKISGNTIINCGFGFDLHDGVSTLNGGAEDCEVHDNTFISMAGPCLISRRNGSGNLPPKRLDIQNNIFALNPSGLSVRVGGNATSGATAAQNITFMNNTMKTGATVQINNGEKLIEGNNIYHDKVGMQPVTPKLSISSAPEFIGEIALVSGVVYYSTGTGSTADWKQITN